MASGCIGLIASGCLVSVFFFVDTTLAPITSIASSEKRSFLEEKFGNNKMGASGWIKSSWIVSVFGFERKDLGKILPLNKSFGRGRVSFCKRPKIPSFQIFVGKKTDFILFHLPLLHNNINPKVNLQPIL
jgi:hypothetical protein